MDRALQILDHLYETNAPAGGYAIAKAIGVPLSTTYLVVDELVERDLLLRRPDGRVWLGPRLYHYGLVYARSLDLLSEARRGMNDLCREVGETVQVCGRERDHVVVLAMADGPGHYRFKSDAGTRVPVAHSASGPLLLGHLPEGERIAILNRSVKNEPLADRAVSVKALSELAVHALESRLSIDIGQNDFRVATIASPICDAADACVATLAIVLPEQKALANRDFYARAARAATEAIENRLGWRGR
jgi:DNA-binding IclR family transcriptional regulator